MTRKEKVDILSELKHEILEHPVFAKKIVRYLESVMEDCIIEYDTAENMNQVSVNQGRRKVANELIGVLNNDRG